MNIAKLIEWAKADPLRRWKIEYSNGVVYIILYAVKSDKFTNWTSLSMEAIETASFGIVDQAIDTLIRSVTP